MYKDLETKQKEIIDFIKKHRKTTTREIKRQTGIKVEKAFLGGIREAFRLAGVELPKHLLKKSSELSRKLAIDFIRKNPNATITEIQSELHINLSRLFGTIENAFRESGVPYENRKIHNYNLKKAEIIELVKNNPLLTERDIFEKTGSSVYSLFRNFKKLYKLCNIKPIDFRQKRKVRKQMEICSYIKHHPKTTQWEINKDCKTHVQELFEGGIREAFDSAGVAYPEINRILYGTAKKSIRKRSMIFQKRVIEILKQFGRVKQQVKVKNGIVDAILELENEIIPIEIKDYRTKPVSGSDINQIKKYIKALKSKRGIIISSKGRFKEIKSEYNITILPISYIKHGVIV